MCPLAEVNLFTVPFHPSSTALTVYPVFPLCLPWWYGEMWSAWIKRCWQASFSSSCWCHETHFTHCPFTVVWGSHAASRCYIPYVKTGQVIFLTFAFSHWREVAGDRDELGLNVFKGCQQKSCLVCSKWFVALFCAVGCYCAVTESGCFTHDGAGIW